MKAADFFKKLQKLAIDNSPTILTGIAVAGTVTTAYLTGKATYKAAQILSEESPYLEPKEKVLLTWKLYIPAAGTGMLTVISIIGANRIGTRRAAALVSAYTLSEKMFDEYKDKVVEKIGQKKEQEVRDELAQDRVNRNPVNENSVIIIGGKSVLCYEAYTGRYFLSDMETLKKAQNDVNYMVNNNFYASLTDFYDKVGLPKTSISDEVGWNCNKLLELNFSTAITEDGRPCLTIDYQVEPIRDFHRVN
jgi:hypothetical protein